jgi:hypothetical protein
MGERRIVAVVVDKRLGADYWLTSELASVAQRGYTIDSNEEAPAVVEAYRDEKQKD